MHETNTDTRRIPKLISAKEAAELLGLSERSIQHKGRAWEDNARAASDADLPSSPRNGLRRARLCDRVHRYHPRDLEEYFDNATRETLGQALVAWRKEIAYHG